MVKEETNLNIPESSLEFFYEDTSWRPLTSEWEQRHFYLARISEDDLLSLKVFEGKGWVEIHGVDDPSLVDAWRVVIEAYLQG